MKEIQKLQIKSYLSVAVEIIVYMPVVLIGMSVLILLISPLTYYLPLSLRGDWIFKYSITEGCMLASALGVAFVILRYWKHGSFADLGFGIKGRGKDILGGMVTAFMLYLLGFGLLWGWGMVDVDGIHFHPYSFFASWVLMLLIALAEETMMRGFVLGRLLSAGVNRYVALFLSAVLFSMMHLFNPNFACLPFLNLIVAGIMLGASYIYTRNLWFPVSLHLFWNWLQGPVLGFEVSGQSFGTSLLALRLPEKNIINGGTFGFEGSIVCTALMIIGIYVILKLASKQSACAQGPHSTLSPEYADE